MAVLYSGDTGSGTNRGFTSKTFSITVSANANRYMVIGVGAYVPSTAIVSGITVNGSAATEIRTLRIEADTQLNSLWGFAAPPTGTYDVIVTLTDVANSLSCGAAVFYNVDQSTPFSGAVSASASTVNVASATGNMVVDSFVTWPENVYSPGAGQIQVYQLNDNPGDPGSITAMSYEAGATSTTMSWSPSSSFPTVVACNLNAVASGSSVVPVIAAQYRQRR